MNSGSIAEVLSSASTKNLESESPGLICLGKEYNPQTDIVVHVIDQGRGQTRHFACSKTKVIKRMKYFDVYFNESTRIEDLDISVHCDVRIFEWLVRFLQDEQ